MADTSQYGDSTPVFNTAKGKGWRPVGHVVSEVMARGIYARAFTAAMKATKAHEDAHGDRGSCGYAWVNLPKDAAKMLKGIGVPVSHGDRIYDPGRSRFQAMGGAEAGCAAFAEVLKGVGIDAWAQSRMD